jgi:hypothetical protein
MLGIRNHNTSSSNLRAASAAPLAAGINSVYKSSNIELNKYGNKN